MRVEVLYLGAGERKVVGELAESVDGKIFFEYHPDCCLLYTSPSPRD